MTVSAKTVSVSLHARLTHPVIDADGHWIEFEPTFLDYLKQVGGPTMIDRYRRNEYSTGLRKWSGMTAEERRARRPLQPAWWAFPTLNSLDRATAMLPRLLYERMADLGLDFAVVYPTLALFFPAMKDQEVRGASYRAYNLMAADMFRDLEDHPIPAACIPMETLAEALAELEVVVNQLGLKVLMFASLLRRPLATTATCSSRTFILAASPMIPSTPGRFVLGRIRSTPNCAPSWARTSVILTVWIWRMSSRRRMSWWTRDY